MKLRWDARTLCLLKILFAVRANKDIEAGRSFVVRVAEVTGRLLTFPMSGRPGVRNRIRFLAIPGTPYVIVYRVRRETVDILRIIYSADRAGIWNLSEGEQCDARERNQAAWRRPASRRPARS
jgi:plasmid stabilization system protein ParE